VNAEPDDEAERRHSVPEEPELVQDKRERAEREAANGLRQFDAGKDAAQQAIERQAQGDKFRLRVSLILSLHQEALAGLSRYAGTLRPGGVGIEKSKHQPPGRHLVAGLVEEMCDYVNDNWDAKSPIHLAAYVMWRLNWIHPFADGNGRTSRITSYVVLTVRSGVIIPGSPTIPQQIVSNRNSYFAALDEADAAWAEGRVDVSAMERLLAGMLANQLMEFYKSLGPEMPEGLDLLSGSDTP
jgi:Fic family protein